MEKRISTDACVGLHDPDSGVYASREIEALGIRLRICIRCASLSMPLSLCLNLSPPCRIRRFAEKSTSPVGQPASEVYIQTLALSQPSRDTTGWSQSNCSQWSPSSPSSFSFASSSASHSPSLSFFSSTPTASLSLSVDKGVRTLGRVRAVSWVVHPFFLSLIFSRSVRVYVYLWVICIDRCFRLFFSVLSLRVLSRV